MLRAFAGPLIWNFAAKTLQKMTRAKTLLGVRMVVQVAEVHGQDPGPQPIGHPIARETALGT